MSGYLPDFTASAFRYISACSLFTTTIFSISWLVIISFIMPMEAFFTDFPPIITSNRMKEIARIAKIQLELKRNFGFLSFFFSGDVLLFSVAIITLLALFYLLLFQLQHQPTTTRDCKSSCIPPGKYELQHFRNQGAPRSSFQDPPHEWASPLFSPLRYLQLNHILNRPGS